MTRTPPGPESVTRRLSLARGADRVIVLADGRIVEDGSPAALRAQNGAYAALERAAQSLDGAIPGTVSPA